MEEAIGGWMNKDGLNDKLDGMLVWLRREGKEARRVCMEGELVGVWWDGGKIGKEMEVEMEEWMDEDSGD